MVDELKRALNAIEDGQEAIGWIISRWTCPKCEAVQETEGDAQGAIIDCDDCGWVGVCRM